VSWNREPEMTFANNKRLGIRAVRGSLQRMVRLLLAMFYAQDSAIRLGNLDEIWRHGPFDSPHAIFERCAIRFLIGNLPLSIDWCPNRDGNLDRCRCVGDIAILRRHWRLRESSRDAAGNTDQHSSEYGRDLTHAV